MLKDLRDQPETPIFQEEETPSEAPLDEPRKKPVKVRTSHRRTFDQITGMSAFQRFVLVFMLFLTICLLGIVMLVLAGKVVPSFLF